MDFVKIRLDSKGCVRYLIDFIDTAHTVQGFLYVEDGGKGEGVFKLTISKL